MVFDREQAAQTMIEDARAFYGHGWLFGTSGNLSVRRTADTFLITASGKDKGRLAEGDFLVCDLDGEPVEETELSPSAETLIHCRIYDRVPDAAAVYHVHEPYAALCSDRDEPQARTRISGVEMIKGLDIWDPDAVIDIPIVENHADIPRLADAVDELLAAADGEPRVPGVNILRHGFYAWGDSPFAAKRHVETFAYLFRYSWERSLAH